MHTIDITLVGGFRKYFILTFGSGVKLVGGFRKKNLHLISFIVRYMKCLAVGMNPNYVLSEDERKRRFRKKNSSVKEKEPATVAPAAPVVKSVGNSESKKMRDEPEMLLTVKKTQTLTEQEETYRTSQAISSQTIHRGSDTEKKCIENSSPRNEQIF